MQGASSSELQGVGEVAEWRWPGPQVAPATISLDLGSPDAPLPDDALERCLGRLAQGDAETLDLGGTPAELHPRFTEFVILARALRGRVLVRATLAAFARPSLSGLPDLLANHGVHLLAALPSGPHDAGTEPLVSASLTGLRLLDEAGYGEYGDEGPRLDLVAWSPGGTEGADALEVSWRQAVRGLRFDRLHIVRSVGVTPGQGLAAHLAALVRAVPASVALGRDAPR